MGRGLIAPAFPVVGTNLALWQLLGANMNSTTDQPLVKNYAFTNYLITLVVAANASTSLTLAVGGLYTTTAKGGTAVIAAAQVYSGMTTSLVTVSPTIANTNMRTTPLWLSLTVAQGSAATMDLYVYGVALS